MPGKVCPHCDYMRMPMEGDGERCPRCEELYAAPPKARPVVVQDMLPSDPIDRAWRLRNFGSLTPEQVGQAAARVEICTLEAMPGKRIGAALGVVSGTYTVAFGAVFEAIAGLARNIGGTGRSPQTEQHIKEGIQHVIGQMRVEAMLNLRAEAVVGIRYQFEEFSGANSKGILVVVGTGTAIDYSVLPAPQ